jgi:phage baseplate assembly protein gpV
MANPAKTIGLEAIQIESPYELVSLTDLRISRKPNYHAQAYFSAIIPEAKKDSYIENATSGDRVEINQVEKGQIVRALFKGLVTKIKVKTVRDIYYLEVEALSSTYELDVKLKKRSFQNERMSYNELFRKVLQEYQGADCNDQISNGAELGRFTIQYEETDWQFLKRMASRFGAALIPDPTQDRPKFWLGIPDGKKVEAEDYHFTVSKNLSEYEKASGNYDDGVIETDFIGYEMESSQILNIGDQVKFQGVNLVVAQAQGRVLKGAFKHNYLLTPKTGVRQNPICNKKIIGAAIRGTVIDCQNDRAKVHLEIDETQNHDEACWFPVATLYTAEGNSGWYWMPEHGDQVCLQFPNEHEENAQIIRAIRKDGANNPKIADPEIKYLGNSHGKELRLDANALKFTVKEEKANKMFIKLDGEAGVEIQSDQIIRIESKNDLMWEGKTIDIRAGLGIYMACDTSSMILNGEVHGKGSVAKIEGFVKSPGSTAEDPASAQKKKPENSAPVGDQVQAGLDINGTIPGVSSPTAKTINNSDLNAGLDALGTIPFQSGGGLGK